MKNTPRTQYALYIALFSFLFRGPAATAEEQPKKSFYAGPTVSRLSIGGDFDGEHVLFNNDTGELAAVPAFDSGVGYGGVFGFRHSFGSAPVDWAIEMTYQQGALNNSLDSQPNNDKATFHELGWTFKTYFRANHALQPVLVVGFDYPWITVPGGDFNETFGLGDETFRGIGIHTGFGLCYFVMPEFSIEATGLYHDRSFTTLNNDSLDSSLNSHSIEPLLMLRYHFGFGANPSRSENSTASAAAVPASSASITPAAPAPNSMGKDPNLF